MKLRGMQCQPTGPLRHRAEADCPMGLIPAGGPEERALATIEPKWMTGCLELSGNGGDRAI